VQTEAGRTDDAQRAAEEPRNRFMAGLYREHGPGLHGLLLGVLRDRAEADEALQQVFLKLLESWETVRLETAKGWLYTAAYHEALARRRRSKVDDAAMSRLWARPVWQTVGERPDPPTALVHRHDRQIVREALADLPDAQRDVVERRVYHDQTFASIAR
jgi:RNA polymerase sigma-70 factor (ECF subfamily)